ncbi:MAG: N-acetyltransferase, partial [Myxococcota bacterium]
MKREKKAAPVRRARQADAGVIKEIVDIYAHQAVLLPRSIEDICRHIGNFAVALDGGCIAGVGALHHYTKGLAEVRSLAVRPGNKNRGLGRRLVESLAARARREGIATIFVMTVVPDFFENLGFRRVPHSSLPEKVWKDCVICPRYNRCDEIAQRRS